MSDLAHRRISWYAFLIIMSSINRLYLRIFIDIKSTFKVLDYIVEMFFPMAVSSFCTSVAQIYRGAVPVFAASFVIMFTVFFGKVA